MYIILFYLNIKINSLKYFYFLLSILNIFTYSTYLKKSKSKLNIFATKIDYKRSI